MMKRTKTVLAAGAAVLAVGAIGGGVAFAASDAGAPNGAVLAAATSSTAPSGGSAAPNAAAPNAHKRHPLLSRIEHGEFSVQTKQGEKVVDVQRGTVTAVNPTSVTVRSPDGFTATYAVGSGSKVRKDKQQSTIGAVQAGDRVLVAAQKSGSTSTVLRLADAGPAPAGH